VSFRVHLTRDAEADLERLIDFVLTSPDPEATLAAHRPSVPNAT
jgi:plasmid stabilization system protein ParE